MASADGTVHLVFNGEIYNHRALRAELEALGHSFRSSSDTEVLLESYRAWGTDCVHHLNGMFAFALHDARRGDLFLARDRAGEKPLFYHCDVDRLLFASELKALLEDPAVPRRLDVQALNHYLAYGYVPREGCILEGFQKLRQGEAMTYDLRTGRLDRWLYWQLPEEDGPNASEDELEEELEALLRDSVRLRLEADVPVGILLSGGLDSSLVTALAAEVSSRPVRTFTVSFRGHSALDEAPFARVVADHFSTDHTQLVADASTVDLLGDMARQFDEPIADSSMIPTHLVCRLIREHATVALGGDGGDELFGGYPHYNWIERGTRLRRVVPAAARTGASSVATALLPPGFKGRNSLRAVLADERESVARCNTYFDAAARRRLLPALAPLPSPALHQPEATKASLVNGSASVAWRAMAVDFMTYLVDDILVKVDRASMLASLEVRSPWLDPRLVEFAFGRVPTSLRVTARERKVLPRRLAARLLPKALDLRRKQGFILPLDAWFRGDWGHYVESVLLDPGAIFDRSQVERLLSWQRRGFRNTQRLFSLAIFELWRRQYRVELPG